MKRRWTARRRVATLAVLVAAAVAAAGIVFTTAAPVAPASDVVSATGPPPRRIMPLGDSLTEGDWIPGGYRVRLALLLQGSQTPFVFVGSQSSGPEWLSQPRHEGHLGWCLDGCTGSIDDHLAEWLSSAQPDIILLHAGMNDRWMGADPAQVTDRLHRVLDRIYQVLPQVHVYVARIRKEGEFGRGATAVVAQEAAQGHFAVLVPMDEEAGFPDSLFYPDGVHPTIDGFNLIADRWFAAMRSSEGF